MPRVGRTGGANSGHTTHVLEWIFFLMFSAHTVQSSAVLAQELLIQRRLQMVAGA